MRIFSTALILLGSLSVLSQERIDDWYGRSLSSLVQALEYHNDKYRVDTLSNGEVSITMIDFRGVPCEYVAVDGVFITHRIDHYTKQEYKKRTQVIKSTWVSRTNYYVLAEQIVAIFNDRNRAIVFIPIKLNMEEYYKAEQRGLDWSFKFQASKNSLLRQKSHWDYTIGK